MSSVVRLETNGSSEPVVEICPRKPATIVATTDDGALVDWTVGDTQIVDPSPDNSITVGAAGLATPSKAAALGIVSWAKGARFGLMQPCRRMG